MKVGLVNELKKENDSLENKHVPPNDSMSLVRIELKKCHGQVFRFYRTIEILEEALHTKTIINKKTTKNKTMQL